MHKYKQPLLRLAFVFALYALLVSCGLNAEPTPERGFGSAELILPVEMMPNGWEMAYEPEPMGSNIGSGDDDDTYVGYKLVTEPYNAARYYVIYSQSVDAASRQFDHYSRTWFSDNRVSIVEPWQTPPELSYQSTYARRYQTACAITQVTSQNQVCHVLAQYEEFVIIFHSVIAPDTMSLQEFNEVLQAIDSYVATRLGLNQEVGA